MSRVRFRGRKVSCAVQLLHTDDLDPDTLTNGFQFQGLRQRIPAARKMMNENENPLAVELFQSIW